jgi:hypothetical protein
VNRQDFTEYCLRALGAPVINIEVDDSQLEDAVDIAIKTYTEYHFDGVDRDYIKHQLTGTTLVLADATGFAVGMQVVGPNCFATIVSINSNTIVLGHATGPGLWANTQAVSCSGQTTTITTTTLGDVDNGYFSLPEDVMGIIKILNLSNVMSASDMLFNTQYQVMMQEIQRITSSQTSYYFSTMNYISHLDFILRKEKDFRFNRRQNKIFLDINWTVDVSVNDYVVIECYRSVNPDTYNNVFNDIWLRKYATATIKKYWGNNLKKYSGMQLPGGLTYNGQEIYNEAIQEMQTLEQDAINNSAPLDFMIG